MCDFHRNHAGTDFIHHESAVAQEDLFLLVWGPARISPLVRNFSDAGQPARNQRSLINEGAGLLVARTIFSSPASASLAAPLKQIWTAVKPESCSPMMNPLFA